MAWRYTIGAGIIDMATQLKTPLEINGSLYASVREAVNKLGVPVSKIRDFPIRAIAPNTVHTLNGKRLSSIDEAVNVLFLQDAIKNTESGV